MIEQPIYKRSMLLRYDRQLVSAKRLARLSRLMNQGREGISPEEIALRRREMVERVAREIVDNLIIVGSDSPMVKAVKDELEEWFGASLLLEYPPTEARLHIFKQTEEGLREMAGAEAETVLAKLWEITLDKVNSTML